MKATVKRHFVGFGREFVPGQTVDLPVEQIEQLNKAGLGILLEVEEAEGADGAAEVNTAVWPKHVGGGHYELSNGDKVKGKEAAAAAQAELDALGN